MRAYGLPRRKSAWEEPFLWNTQGPKWARAKSRTCSAASSTASIPDEAGLADRKGEARRDRVLGGGRRTQRRSLEFTRRARRLHKRHQVTGRAGESGPPESADPL